MNSEDDAALPRLVGRAALEAALSTSRNGRGHGRRHKYGVAPAAERRVGEVTFDSKAEGRRYEELLGLVRAGAVRFFLRQVPFHLPGRVRYVCDFAVFWADGRTSFEDVKGHRTSTYLVKKRLVEALYPVTIEEVRPAPARRACIRRGRA